MSSISVGGSLNQEWRRGDEHVVAGGFFGSEWVGVDAAVVGHVGGGQKVV
jgi:hypothetical protein